MNHSSSFGSRATPVSSRMLVCWLLFVALGCGQGAQTSASPASSSIGSETVAQAPAAAASELQWTAVENPRARYLAALGMPTAQDDSVSREHLAHARLHAARTLQSFHDVELAPAHFDRSALLAEGKRRKLPGVFFECGVTSHDVDAQGTHFAVNVTVVDIRTANIVASMTGRATAPGPSSAQAQQQALEGALNVAMRGVPQLLAGLDLPANQSEALSR